jgi:DNA adenine methylase
VPSTARIYFPTSKTVKPLAPAPSPIVKWVGGKGGLLPQLIPLLPPGVELMRHVEPFLGGGALFFRRGPARALLCDINQALIDTYSAVRDEVESVIAWLTGLASEHNAEQYYQVRELYNEDKGLPRAKRAAAFIYLNKTCFNGLHRVNRHGQFNVPLGRYENPRIVDPDRLRVASQVLSSVELRCEPFESLLRLAKPGDFVYFDPPYEPVSRTAHFTAYDRDGFSREDQIRLRDVFNELDRRGCRLMLSNSDVPVIRDLYRGYHLTQVAALRAVNCDGRNRGRVSELVVRNYERVSDN